MFVPQPLVLALRFVHLVVHLAVPARLSLLEPKILARTLRKKMLYRQNFSMSECNLWAKEISILGFYLIRY